MHLIVGLGNPGKEYENTRHNTGFRVIDRLIKELRLRSSKSLCRAFINEGSIDGQKVIFAKPQMFMNLSGESVLELAKWFKLEAKQLIVIYDDLDLELGALRIKTKGNSGGHKGMESIIQRMGTSEFPRIRIGIGRPDRLIEESDAADYVLSKIPKKEIDAMDGAEEAAAEAAVAIVKDGIEAAMNKYNAP